MNEYSSIYLFFSPTSNHAGQGSREVMWEVVQCIISISDEWRSDPLVTVPQQLRYMKKSNKGECNLHSELGCCLWRHSENYWVVLPEVFCKQFLSRAMWPGLPKSTCGSFPLSLTAPVPRSWTSSWQSCERIHFSCLSHPVCGTLLAWAREQLPFPMEGLAGVSATGHWSELLCIVVVCPVRLDSPRILTPQALPSTPSAYYRPALTYFFELNSGIIPKPSNIHVANLHKPFECCTWEGRVHSAPGQAGWALQV